MAKLDMRANRSAYRFEESEILRFDESLRPIEPLLESLSSAYGCVLLHAASKGWPGRTLRQRHWLKTYLFRISLEPAYVDTGLVRWEFHDIWMYDWGELLQRVLTFRRLLAGVDSAMIESGRASVVIEDAVRQNL